MWKFAFVNTGLLFSVYLAFFYSFIFMMPTGKGETLVAKLCLGEYIGQDLAC